MRIEGDFQTILAKVEEIAREVAPDIEARSGNDYEFRIYLSLNGRKAELTKDSWTEETVRMMARALRDQS